MNGHQTIIDMRRNGLKPKYVWLQDEQHAPTDFAVTLCPTDIPEALDFRFLVGITVIVESSNKKRLQCLVNALKQAKAARTIASLYQRTSQYHFDVVDVSDSEGVLTWQK